MADNQNDDARTKRAKEIARKILYFCCFIFPFISGTAGYYLAGLSVTDSLYSSFVLYTINPFSDEVNLLIELARWLAPLMLASGVLLVFKRLSNRVRNHFLSKNSNTIFVYGDSSYGELLTDTIPHTVLVEENKVCRSDKTEKSIIMFSDDGAALEFYEKNKTHFQNQMVYMKLDHFNPLYLPHKNIRYFNLNDIIARNYWKEHDLLAYRKDGGMHIRIAIIGYGDLGERILYNGLLNNLYSLDQCITYHIWFGNNLYQNLHQDFFEPNHTMNQDSVVFHQADLSEEIYQLAEMDRIIIADHVDHKLMAAIFEISSRSEVDIFSPDGSLGFSSDDSDSFSIYDNNCVNVFGEYKALLTEDHIINNTLYKLAMMLNYYYILKYSKEHKEKLKNAVSEEQEWAILDELLNNPDAYETEWNALTGFLKTSNITAADYNDIRLKIMKAENSTELTAQVCELEHIRWCRFHFLNHWKYGEKRDKIKMLHPDLVPFASLSTEEERNKDKEMIRFLMRYGAERDDI